jgi:prepilin-type processing-associated H-X9-DG protein
MIESIRKHWQFVLIWTLIGTLLLVIIPPACNSQNENVARTSCQANFKQLAQRLEMYAAENRDLYPTIQKQVGPGCDQPNQNIMMFDGPGMYPDYFDDWRLLVCPEANEAALTAPESPWTANGEVNPCQFDNSSYFYFGWAVPPAGTDVETGIGFVDGVGRLLKVASTEVYNANYEFIDNQGNSHTLYRLQQRLDRKMGGVTVAPHEIPVMMDVFTSLAKTEHFNHSPGGSNVLYLDGHVDFLRYTPNAQVYPMTEAMGEFMVSLQKQQAAGK